MIASQLPVRGYTIFAEDSDNFIEGRLSRLNQCMCQLVCVNDRYAESAETLCYCRFTAANTTGQADHQRVFAIYAQGVRAIQF